MCLVSLAVGVGLLAACGEDPDTNPSAGHSAAAVEGDLCAVTEAAAKSSNPGPWTLRAPTPSENKSSYLVRTGCTLVAETPDGLLNIKTEVSSFGAADAKGASDAAGDAGADRCAAVGQSGGESSCRVAETDPGPLIRVIQHETGSTMVTDVTVWAVSPANRDDVTEVIETLGPELSKFVKE